MIRKIEFAIDISELVHEQTVQQIIDVFNNILAEISNISVLDDSTYVGEGKDYIANIHAHMENLKLYWIHFTTAAIEKKDF